MSDPRQQDPEPSEGSNRPETRATDAIPPTAAQLAQRILANPRIKVGTQHLSRVRDNATADKQLAATAQGQKASRSSYGHAPGGCVALDRRMLAGMLSLAETYSFHVAEIAGGSHCTDSRHYAGVAFDVLRINGAAISAAHPHWRAFIQKARSLGATETLGPGVAGHATHIHLGWPRSASAPNGGLALEGALDNLLEEIDFPAGPIADVDVAQRLRTARAELESERARIAALGRNLLPSERSRLVALIEAISHLTEAIRALDATR